MSAKKSNHHRNNAVIGTLKFLHNLKAGEIADITGYARSTVYTWLANSNFLSYRPAPNDAVEKLLKKYSLDLSDP